MQYKQRALTWQRSKFIVALKIDGDGWVLHVQCAVAGQKQSPKNPEFRCSVLHVAESATSYFTPFVRWHLPKTHNNSRKQRN